MRFIIVLVTVFSVCCSFSVLNIYPLETNGQGVQLVERNQLNNILTEEEILRCRSFMDMNLGDLSQMYQLKEMRDITLKCSLFLQQDTALSAENNFYDIDRSPPIKTRRNDELELTIEEKENSKEVNDENTGVKEILCTNSERSDYADNSNSEPLSGNEKNSDASGSGFWSYFFRHKGSSVDPDPDPVAIAREKVKIEKPLSKPENGKAEIDVVINTGWSLWSYLSSLKDSSDAAKESISGENAESDQTAQSGIGLRNATDFVYTTTEMAIWNIVMPGTKWCGSGDIAKSDDDLGYFKDVDMCCRAHDLCDDIMWPGEAKYNLTNTSPFTLLNCKCDDELYNCLSQINSFAANTVGNTFFNIFGRKCFKLEFPEICKNYHAVLGCLEYGIDETAEKVYQWKPAKKYVKYPFNLPR